MWCNKNFRWLLIIPFLLAAGACMAQIRYFGQPTISFPEVNVRYYLEASQDSIVNDTLFQVLSKEGYPLSYFRKIRTSVCFDNKCRLLKCVIYWNITGRYLGFELPPGEFLSKAKHKEFTPGEYERLGVLLADQSSPLGVLSYSELAPVPKTTTSVEDEVDGVSSATAKSVLDYVVEGAAYTTYKMWNVVYGVTQDDVMRLTTASLTPALTLKILESPDLNDRIWALNHIRGFVPVTPALNEKLLSLITDDNYNLTERVINAFGPAELKPEAMQISLVGKFNTASYAIKKLIIAKLKEAPTLSLPVIKSLAQSLKSQNGELVSNILDTFAKHKVTDAETVSMVAEILNNPNSFISQKVYKYLEGLAIKDETITKRMKEYASKR